MVVYICEAARGTEDPSAGLPGRDQDFGRRHMMITDLFFFKISFPPLLPGLIPDLL